MQILCRRRLVVFLVVVVVVGFHCIVTGREKLLAHLFVCQVVELCSLLANHSTRVAGISVGSTAPGGLVKRVSTFSAFETQSSTYHAESHEGIVFDETMEPAEEDAHWP